MRSSSESKPKRRCAGCNCAILSGDLLSRRLPVFDGRKQIVLSSDRPASEIANLEQRLVSRFECGLTTELQPPYIETRMAILRKKTEEFHIQLGEDVQAFLAQRVRSNVRRLEGALMRVASYLSLSGREIPAKR
jgi:chromosomal replication initiator protein